MLLNAPRTHTHSAGAPAILSSCHQRTQFRDRKFVSPIKRYTTCKNRSIALQPVERAARFLRAKQEGQQKTTQSKRLHATLYRPNTICSSPLRPISGRFARTTQTRLDVVLSSGCVFPQIGPRKKHNFAHFKDTTRRRLNGAVNSSRWCVKFNHNLKHVQNLEHLNTKKVQSAIRGVNGRTLS